MGGRAAAPEKVAGGGRIPPRKKPKRVVCSRFSKKEGHGRRLGTEKRPTESRSSTRKKSNRTTAENKAMMAEDGDFLRPIVRSVIQIR
jgi:hypothetical protein